MVQQWPLSVGIYVPSTVRTCVLAEHLWRVPAGEAATKTFQWALQQMFANLVDLDVPPSTGTVPNGLAGVVELSDISYTYTMPRVFHNEIELYSRKGERIGRWSITSPGLNWDVEQSSLSSTIQSVGSEVAYCIRDATAQFMVSFSRSPEVRSWLASEGIATTEARPVFSGQDGSTEHKPRVLLVPNISNFLYTDASLGMTCVGNRLRKSSPPIEVIQLDNVRLEFFPWLEPSTAPKTIEEVRSWLFEPAVQQKARVIGVRYLLVFHGGTKTKVDKGRIICTPPVPGGGCFGYSWGSRKSSFSAAILDMWSADKLSYAIASQQSGVYIPAFFLPVPILAPTEAKACEELTRIIHGIIMQKVP
jgi:hypothetical protein